MDSIGKNKRKLLIMRYAGLVKNDIVDGDDGIAVALYFQGCPHHCKGCHNPETWDFNGGIEIDREKLIENVIDSLTENGVKRNLSILGGEPLAPQNIDNTIYILSKIRERFKDIKILLWTGYNFKDIKKDKQQKKISKLVNKIIDGKYIEELRDTTLELRGSSNQNIINLDKY